jgi:hypothetical protein
MSEDQDISVHRQRHDVRSRQSASRRALAAVREEHYGFTISRGTMRDEWCAWRGDPTIDRSSKPSFVSGDLAWNAAGGVERAF